MTEKEKDAQAGQIARTYQNLLTTRFCHMKRLAEHAGNVSRVLHALENWNTSREVAGILDLLDEPKLAALRSDVESLIDIEKEIEQAEMEMREVGFSGLIQNGSK